MASSAIEDLKDNRVPPCLYWSNDQVCEWIVELDLPQYKVRFITLPLFIELQNCLFHLPNLETRKCRCRPK